MGTLAEYLDWHGEDASIGELIKAVLDSRLVTEQDSDGVGITAAGYILDRAGMEEWRDDVRRVLDHVANIDAKAYTGLVAEFERRDPNGWKTIVGTVWHDGEEQLVDIGIIIGDEGTDKPQEETVGTPTTTTTTTTVPPATTTTVPPVTTIPPVTTPATTVPPTTTEPRPKPGDVEVPDDFWPSETTTTTRPEEPSSSWPRPSRPQDQRLPTRPTGPGTGPWNPNHALPGDPGWTGLPPSDGPWRDPDDPAGVPSGLWPHNDPPEGGVEGLWWWPGETPSGYTDEASGYTGEVAPRSQRLGDAPMSPGEQAHPPGSDLDVEAQRLLAAADLSPQLMSAFYLDALRVSHVHAIQEGAELQGNWGLGSRIRDHRSSIDGTPAPYTVPEENRQLNALADAFLSKLGISRNEVIDLLVNEFGVAPSELAYAWDIPTEPIMRGGKSQAPFTPEFYMGNPLDPQQVPYSGDAYRPNNWFTYRQGTDLAPEAEEVYGRGGDPRYPGVQVGQQSELYATMETSQGMQAGTLSGLYPHGYGVNYQDDWLIPNTPTEWVLEAAFGVMFGPAGMRLIRATGGRMLRYITELPVIQNMPLSGRKPFRGAADNVIPSPRISRPVADVVEPSSTIVSDDGATISSAITDAADRVAQRHKIRDGLAPVFNMPSQRNQFFDALTDDQIFAMYDDALDNIADHPFSKPTKTFDEAKDVLDTTPGGVGEGDAAIFDELLDVSSLLQKEIIARGHRGLAIERGWLRETIDSGNRNLDEWVFRKERRTEIPGQGTLDVEGPPGTPEGKRPEGGWSSEEMGGDSVRPFTRAENLIHSMNEYQGMFSSPDDGTRLFEEFKTYPDRYGYSGIDEDPVVYATERGTFTARELTDDEIAEAFHSNQAAGELREHQGISDHPNDDIDLYNEIWRRFTLGDTPTAGLERPPGGWPSEFGDYPADWDHLLTPEELQERLAAEPGGYDIDGNPLWEAEARGEAGPPEMGPEGPPGGQPPDGIHTGGSGGSGDEAINRRDLARLYKQTTDAINIYENELWHGLGLEGSDMAKEFGWKRLSDVENEFLESSIRMYPQSSETRETWSLIKEARYLAAAQEEAMRAGGASWRGPLGPGYPPGTEGPGAWHQTFQDALDRWDRQAPFGTEGNPNPDDPLLGAMVPLMVFTPQLIEALGGLANNTEGWFNWTEDKPEHLDAMARIVEAALDGTARADTSTGNETMDLLTDGFREQANGLASVLGTGITPIISREDSDLLKGVGRDLRSRGVNSNAVFPNDIRREMENGDAMIVGYNSQADYERAMTHASRYGVEVNGHYWRKPTVANVRPANDGEWTREDLKRKAAAQHFYPDAGLRLGPQR